MSQNHVLVSGAGGFMGHHLVTYLDLVTYLLVTYLLVTYLKEKGYWAAAWTSRGLSSPHRRRRV